MFLLHLSAPLSPAVLYLVGLRVEGAENHPVLFSLHALHVYYLISPLIVSLLPWGKFETTKPTLVLLFKAPLEGAQILC